MEQELTPAAAEQTLEIAPPAIAEDVPPTGEEAFDAEGNPLAVADPSPVVESGDEQQQPKPDAIQAETALQQLLQERIELQQVLEQAEQQRAQAEAEAYWNAYEKDLNEWFQSASKVVYGNSQNAFDQSAYIQNEMGKLQAQYAHGQKQLREAREGAILSEIQRQQYPKYVAQVAQSYGLPPEAMNDLLHLPKGTMEKEASRLAAVYHTIQGLYRENDQLKRSRAAQAVGGVAPGGGRAAGGRIKAGSRDHLLALWGKGR